MPTAVQFRRGTTAQNNSFTGAAGELSVDTTLGTIRVHNGSTAGGNTLATIDAVQTLTNKTLTSPTITSPTVSGTLSSTGLINTTGNIICATISAGTYVGLSSQRINQDSSNVIATTSFVNVAVNGSNVAAFSATGFIVGIDSGATSIRNAGTNGVGNIGATGATFNTVFAKATTAQYADLAEIYTSDQQYPGGTVVIFGGEAEVTQSNSPNDTRIAGVVSSNPAYLMNSNETGVPVALQGRVSCRVLGPVSKGDRVVSSHIAGVAQALDPLLYQPGCIIGKALQAIDSAEISIIEVVVGRV